ncbi:MAG: hypothetical protein ACI9D5_001467 [Candidatus Endobugula sp.]|jgi:hypothetical protein
MILLLFIRLKINAKKYKAIEGKIQQALLKAIIPVAKIYKEYDFILFVIISLNH